MKKLNLKIEGMHCKSCEIVIGDTLKEISGVFNVKIDYKSGFAEIEFDENKVKEVDLVSAIKKEGYKVRR